MYSAHTRVFGRSGSVVSALLLVAALFWPVTQHVSYLGLAECRLERQ